MQTTEFNDSRHVCCLCRPASSLRGLPVFRRVPISNGNAQIPGMSRRDLGRNRIRATNFVFRGNLNPLVSDWHSSATRMFASRPASGFALIDFRSAYSQTRQRTAEGGAVHQRPLTGCGCGRIRNADLLIVYAAESSGRTDPAMTVSGHRRHEIRRYPFPHPETNSLSLAATRTNPAIGRQSTCARASIP